MNRRKFLQGAGALTMLASCATLPSEYQYQERLSLTKQLIDFKNYLDLYYRETTPTINNTYPIHLSVELWQGLEEYDFQELKNMKYSEISIISGLCTLLKEDLEEWRKGLKQEYTELEKNLKVNSDTFLRALYLSSPSR